VIAQPAILFSCDILNLLVSKLTAGKSLVQVQMSEGEVSELPLKSLVWDTECNESFLPVSCGKSRGPNLNPRGAPGLLNSPCMNCRCASEKEPQPPGENKKKRRKPMIVLLIFKRTVDPECCSLVISFQT